MTQTKIAVNSLVLNASSQDLRILSGILNNVLNEVSGIHELVAQVNNPQDADLQNQLVDEIRALVWLQGQVNEELGDRFFAFSN